MAISRVLPSAVANYKLKEVCEELERSTVAAIKVFDLSPTLM